MGEKSMRRGTYTRGEFLGLGVAGAAILAGCGGGQSGSKGGGTTTLNALFMQQAAYSSDNVNSMTKAFEKQNPGIKVNPTFVAYEALHDKIITAAPAGSYDVVLMDVIWPAEFATKKIVAKTTGRIPPGERSKILGGALQAVGYKGDYYGFPWILDTKYFYYNEDMLRRAGVKRAPATWDEVVAAAKAVKSKGIIKYPLVWSWAQAEALICDYTQLLGAFGGRFFDGSGNPAFNTGGGLAALKFMKMTLDEGLTNPSSITSIEDDVRKVVSQGQAAMALNWTYMFALANDPKQSRVAGKIKIAHTPRGPGGAPGVNGSMGLAITRGSQNQDAAWRYIQFIASQKIQDRYAKLSLPVWKSSYDKKQVIDALPQVVPVAKKQLNNMILRPQVASYNDFSHELQVQIQLALKGKKSPEQALDDAARTTASILKSS